MSRRAVVSVNVIITVSIIVALTLWRLGACLCGSRERGALVRCCAGVVVITSSALWGMGFIEYMILQQLAESHDGAVGVGYVCL